jgi:hypothetical protein
LAFIIICIGSIPLLVEGATRAVVVVETDHTPAPATIKVAAIANKLVLRIWVLPSDQPHRAAAQANEH